MLVNRIKIFWLSFFSLLIVVPTVRCQNLVPNPSFEDTVSCPTSVNQFSKVKFWINPTQCTPDYFNSCSSGAHVPNNVWGNQNAHSGSAYAGIYAFAKPFPNGSREYIQTNFPALNSNHRYLVSFYLSLADNAQYAVSSLGIYFSSSSIAGSGCNILNHFPQILNKQSNSLNDKTNWMFIMDTLYADGTEQYLTIGNFLNDSLSDTLYLGNVGGSNVAYYYVDDVSLIDDGPMSISNYNKDHINIFPNPASDVLNVEYPICDCTIKVTDVLGNTIDEKPISNKISVSCLPNGIYFLVITDNERHYQVNRRIVTNH
jgi:hypothetical protein